MKKKKILFVNQNLPYGGGAMMIVWVANVFAKAGYGVTFVTYRNCEKSYLTLDPTIKSIELASETEGRSIGATIKTISLLRKILVQNKIDVAIAFLTASQLRLGLAAVGTETKVLLSNRVDPYQKNKNASLKTRIITHIMHFMFCKADAFVFQTKMAQEFYSKKVQSRSTVIPNPVRELKRSNVRDINSVEKRIVNVARFELIQKRQDVLVKAFDIVSKKYPEYVLELYGDGPDEKKVREMVKHNPNIKIMGVSTDIISRIQNASFSVLSSDFEGIPNVVLESMTLQVPCISTDCSPGGASMLIQSGKNGLIVPCRDYESLANAMIYYIEHPTEAEEYAKKALYVREVYSEQKIAQKWIDFVERI